MDMATYQHEVIVPNPGLKFKIFPFEGGEGRYIRERHWHRSIEIFCVYEGKIDFFLDEERYTLGAGSLMIVNSNEVHSIHANDSNTTYVLQIPLDLFADYYGEDPFIWFSHNQEQWDTQTFDMIVEMARLNMSGETGSELLMTSLFYKLLYQLVIHYRTVDVEDEIRKSNRKLRKLGKITAYLKEHYAEDISLKTLSEMYGYSPYYLSRMFQKYAKINYKDYLQSVRLEHAAKELMETDKTIGDIALDNGFANSKAFSNLFRKHYEMLPKEYRKRQKNDID